MTSMTRGAVPSSYRQVSRGNLRHRVRVRAPHRHTLIRLAPQYALRHVRHVGASKRSLLATTRRLARLKHCLTIVRVRRIFFYCRHRGFFPPFFCLVVEATARSWWICACACCCLLFTQEWVRGFHFALEDWIGRQAPVLEASTLRRSWPTDESPRHTQRV